MKYFKIKYVDGNFKIVSGKNTLDIVKRYDLCTREHINTRIIELEGEQLAIAINNNQ